MEAERVLVIGAGGFIGNHLLRFLRSQAGVEVAAIDLVSPSEGDTQIHWYGGNARDRNFLHRVMDEVQPTKIVHLVGILHADSLSELMDVNVGAAQTLLDTMLVAGLLSTKVLLIGSAAEYGVPEKNPVAEDHPTRPVSPYGLTKLFQTQLGQFYFRNYGLSVVVARPFNIDGEGISTDLSVGSWRKQIAEAEDGSSIQVGTLRSVRDYLPVHDAVEALWYALTYGVPGEVYNVCSGQGIKMADVLKRLIEDSGKNIKIELDETRLKPNEVPVVYGCADKLAQLRP